ncbi:D-aminoacyl-tRNA deacylase [Phaeovulum sp.]|uniref:D-aminoacyl-tRNA deacylase n=1 Tax=Phaeovulum sp. TaxID=2934796 RepID=UPI002731CDFF|nr:D-aminoacyl-tRNA deacylase [Phaeovulum sp.]MDP1668589.1 D-aminoacyl-tRNA deacylase [Phaeovulum sp.]MDP2062963.1 D-aminoacyl-tRNA deacylase [Phaeovulum sp.]MDP3860602.1 D-aminoacyl-tRNA deacylase [Phaeovulum sp.]MDZ4119922.1 D-aminoacyl-tRNA deacylase [Phaeovulum sp.]
MRVLVQRVSEARVTVAGRVTGEIGRGLVLLVCAMQGDTEAEAEKLAGRVARLRIFRDAAEKMNLSLQDVGGAALVVSQFTLAADTSRGNRPGFSTAAPPELGERLYQHFAAHLRGLGLPVEMGEFGADMAVALVNDGPVTIWMDTAERG